MEFVTRYVEKKRRRLEEIASEVARLREEIEALSREEVKVRTQIETAEDMVLELGPVVPKMAEKPTLRASRKKRPTERRAARSTGITLVDAIRQVTRDLAAPFSTGEVRVQLQERYPELANQMHHSSLAGTMRRMSVGGQLEQVEKGGPGKEATYRLPNHAAAQQPHSASRMDEQSTIFEGERELVESAR
ncbi:MAG: hypothetical protein ACJ76J_22580 [Thermoanaerobaculia bacterium]